MDFAVTGMTGLEPAASALTGQRSNQLSYTPNISSRRNEAEYTPVFGKIQEARPRFIRSLAEYHRGADASPGAEAVPGCHQW